MAGAHTFGRAKCSTFVERLYDFNNTGNPDPTVNTSLLETLRVICPQNGTGSNLPNLDMTTPDLFDNAYYSKDYFKVIKSFFQLLVQIPFPLSISTAVTNMLSLQTFQPQ